MNDLFGCGRTMVLATAAVFAVACGGGDGGDGAGGMEEAGGGEEMASPVDMATAGGIHAMVMFEGMAPDMMAIDMAAEPTCAAKYSDAPMTEEVVVGDGGGLANVFVYVKEGLDGSMSFPAPSSAVVVDQNGCRYVPHVVGVQAGQDLTFRNSDGLLHNINASPSTNRGFNISQPVNMDTNRDFGMAEVMVPVRCDVHGWMTAFVGVVDHPFHGVTGMEGGADLGMLPPGEYVVEAWHERYGMQTANVTVATGETAMVSFSFSDAMAANAVVPMGNPIDPHGPGAHATAPETH
jgi:plastocyanin